MDGVAVDGFVREKVLCEAIERVAVITEQRERTLLRRFEQRFDFVVDDALRLLGICAARDLFVAEIHR